MNIRFLKQTRKLKKRFLVNLLFILYAGIGYSQISITGNITESDGSPLPGANVLVKGSDTGTQSDFDGNFSIVTKSGDVLVVSYVGFVTQEFNITQTDELNIQLIENASSLDEVVVIGYGTKSKAKLISAVSTVNEKTLKSIPVPNVSNALEGLASGLFVRQTSGEPGFSNSSFEIRNFRQALVIVDGSPGDLNQLDPNEIESMSILKDAAAASEYGVQGGNGVVLITTKKGIVGKPKLTYSNKFTFTSFTAYPDFLTSAQYGEVMNEGLRNANQTPFYTEEEIAAFKTGSDPINYPNTD